MSKKPKIALNIQQLADRGEIVIISLAEGINLYSLHEKVKACLIEALYSALEDTTRPNGTRTSPQRLACMLDSRELFSAGQAANTFVLNRNTEKKKAVAELLHQQTRVVKRLVRAQDRSRPIRSRKPDPILVDSLIYQIEMLLSMLDEHVFPRLEQTGNNKH